MMMMTTSLWCLTPCNDVYIHVMHMYIHVHAHACTCSWWSIHPVWACRPMGIHVHIPWYIPWYGHVLMCIHGYIHVYTHPLTYPNMTKWCQYIYVLVFWHFHQSVNTSKYRHHHITCYDDDVQYMCIHMYMHMYAHVYTWYIHAHGGHSPLVYTPWRVYTYVHTCVNTCVYTCVYACIYIHVYITWSRYTGHQTIWSHDDIYISWHERVISLDMCILGPLLGPPFRGCLAAHTTMACTYTCIHACACTYMCMHMPMYHSPPQRDGMGMHAHACTSHVCTHVYIVCTRCAWCLDPLFRGVQMDISRWVGTHHEIWAYGPLYTRYIGPSVHSAKGVHMVSTPWSGMYTCTF